MPVKTIQAQHFSQLDVGGHANLTVHDFELAATRAVRVLGYSHDSEVYSCVLTFARSFSTRLCALSEKASYAQISLAEFQQSAEPAMKRGGGRGLSACSHAVMLAILLLSGPDAEARRGSLSELCTVAEAYGFSVEKMKLIWTRLQKVHGDPVPVVEIARVLWRELLRSLYPSGPSGSTGPGGYGRTPSVDPIDGGPRRRSRSRVITLPIRTPRSLDESLVTNDEELVG